MGTAKRRRPPAGKLGNCWGTGSSAPQAGAVLAPHTGHLVPSLLTPQPRLQTPLPPPGYEYLIKHLLHMPLSYLPGFRLHRLAKYAQEAEGGTQLPSSASSSGLSQVRKQCSDTRDVLKRGG